ncbi:hypothetical protein H5410_050606 [Solanum commersonii]|uniref:Uncharacterized protein n=1 Tax=Solanum commersonii TaxID=4109 RepID=A0A9J5WVY6_SOLCO|nr:hypothetical protein H5410_050606 [Solanum commersonii]
MKPLSVEDFLGGEEDYKEKTSDKINKISEKYSRKLVQRMYYYPRPTPQDVLLEEHEHKEIYEWNIDENFTHFNVFWECRNLFLGLKFIKPIEKLLRKDISISSEIAPPFIEPSGDDCFDHYNYLHIGMVQIAVKPLTLKGLPETFFPGSELISLSYRIYFKLLSTLNPRYFPTSWTLNSVISPNQLTYAVTNSDFSHISQNPDRRICIQFSDNRYAPHRQSFSNNKLMSYVNHSFNRQSLSSRRLMPAIHHISLVEPIYGLARDRTAALHTIASDSNSVVEKVKIDPRTNTVKVIMMFLIRIFLLSPKWSLTPTIMIPHQLDISPGSLARKHIQKEIFDGK